MLIPLISCSFVILAKAGIRESIYNPSRLKPFLPFDKRGDVDSLRKDSNILPYNPSVIPARLSRVNSGGNPFIVPPVHNLIPIPSYTFEYTNFALCYLLFVSVTLISLVSRVQKHPPPPIT